MMGILSPFSDKTAFSRLNPQLFDEVVDGWASRHLATNRRCG
jgi:hypothetical protein